MRRKFDKPPLTLAPDSINQPHADHRVQPQERSYLIDRSAYIYRAFFALPALNNSKGLQTHAILGFTTTLLKIIRERKPDGLVVAFDEKGPTLRHAKLTAYKAQRPPKPEGMSAQIPYIHRVVGYVNIPAVRRGMTERFDRDAGSPGRTGRV